LFRFQCRQKFHSHSDGGEEQRGGGDDEADGIHNVRHHQKQKGFLTFFVFPLNFKFYFSVGKTLQFLKLAKKVFLFVSSQIRE
jgi:hypothetical protein